MNTKGLSSAICRNAVPVLSALQRSSGQFYMTIINTHIFNKLAAGALLHSASVIATMTAHKLKSIRLHACCFVS